MLVIVGTVVAGCSREPSPDSLFMTGHSDLVLSTDSPEQSGGTNELPVLWLPLVLGDELGPRLCFESERGPLDGSEDLKVVVSKRRLGFSGDLLKRTERYACTPALQLPEDLGSGRTHELCARLEHEDGVQEELGCQSFEFRKSDGKHSSLVSDRDAILDQRGERRHADQLRALDKVIEAAEAAGYPLLAARTRIVSAQFSGLEGGDLGVAEARKRLSAAEDLLGSQGALRERADAYYQRASLDLSAGHLDSAWRLLQLSEELSRQVGALEDARTAVILQAQVLEKLGAPARGAARLRAELGRSLDAEEDFARYARGTLAWLLLLDPLSAASDLEEVRRDLAQDIESGAFADDPVEEANQRINTAFLDQRLGRSSVSLEQARANLRSLQGETEWREELLDWSDLIEGLGYLEAPVAKTAEIESADIQTEMRAAIAACEGLVGHAQSQVSAWASSCLARAYEKLDDLDNAARFYQRAQLESQLGEAEIGRGFGLGISQASLDYYRNARLELSRDDPDAAWDLLEQLDALSSQESEQRSCRELAEPGTPASQRWAEIGAETQRLLELLRSFDGRASKSWRRQQQEVTTEIRQKIHDLTSEWPGCAEQSLPHSNAVLDYRAFWVDDEIFLLNRQFGQLDASTFLVRRGVLSAEFLEDAEGKLEGWSSQNKGPQDLPEAAIWRSVFEPIAEALLPDDLSSFRKLSTWALHGRLQQLPLAALPVGSGWLADATVVARRPAQSLSQSAVVPVSQQDMSDQQKAKEELGRPLFVVDPERNLRGARRLAGGWAEGLGAHILSGEEATIASFQQSLSTATWLHIGAHIDYDADFPELSRLRLADGNLRWIELFEQDFGVEFANLSACDSGRWPPTADSGSYGLAGLLARRGARFVVASRAPLANQVAIDLNTVLYAELADGATVPEAYARAHAELRANHSPAAWAPVMFLQSGPATGLAAEH